MNNTPPNGRATFAQSRIHAYTRMVSGSPNLEFSIPTDWNGTSFRSRLEARWAVFFETAGIEWVYEPQTFKLGPERIYTPDFFLPKMNRYVEVKPTGDHADRSLLHLFVQSTGHEIILLSGFPSVDPVCRYNADTFFSESDDFGRTMTLQTGATVFVLCRGCLRPGLEDIGIHVPPHASSGAGWAFCCSERAGLFDALKDAFRAASNAVFV